MLFLPMFYFFLVEQLFSIQQQFIVTTSANKKFHKSSPYDLCPAFYVLDI